MGRHPQLRVTREAVEVYVRATYGADAHVLEMMPLSENEHRVLKSFGYGEPTRITIRRGHWHSSIVLHTMSPDAFGHDRRCDRVASMLGAYDIYAMGAVHVRPLDAGFIEGGQLVSGGRGEPFVITEYVPGDLYAATLVSVAKEEVASDADRRRVYALTDFIASMRAKKATAQDYRRSIRDIVGSGEGIFGLRDAYADDDGIATPERLLTISGAACGLRETMRRFEHRACEIHGDLHPYNVIFDRDNRLHLLDRSRGGVGEIADDVTCMAINYVAIALRERGAFVGALRELWMLFWSEVLAKTGDHEMLEVVPLFFIWRVLVLACPLWYPHTPPLARERLLCFAEQLLGGACFDPTHVDELLR